MKKPIRLIILEALQKAEEAIAKGDSETATFYTGYAAHIVHKSDGFYTQIDEDKLFQGYVDIQTAQG